jgi:hypothetical protein
MYCKLAKPLLLKTGKIKIVDVCGLSTQKILLMYPNLRAEPVRRKSKEIVHLLRKKLAVIWRLKMILT